jgi:hypothetical protein
MEIIISNEVPVPELGGEGRQVAKWIDMHLFVHTEEKQFPKWNDVG